MKIEKLLLFCVLIANCSSEEYIDNQAMIDSIDALEFTEIITEIEVDSIGNILDTLSIEYLKFDDQNRKRFKKEIYWYENEKWSWIDYFKPDEDLFYRESFDEEGNSNSIFETKSNLKGRVVSALEISKEREPHDTVFMNYSHKFYLNGNVRQLVIQASHKEIDNLISKTEYDKNKNPLVELMMIKKDTISFQIWEYLDTMLQKSIYTNYQTDTSKSVYHFGEQETLIKEEEFEFKEGQFIQSKEINHFYNEIHERTKSIEKNSKTNIVKYVRYLKSTYSEN